MELVKPTQSDKYAEDFGLSDGDKVYLYEYHMECNYNRVAYIPVSLKKLAVSPVVRINAAWLDKPVKIRCDIADTMEKKVRGLQGAQELKDHAGLYFPYVPYERVIMHQAEVSFPLDIMFIQDDHVCRIVENTKVGSSDIWAWDHCTGVIEVNAGYCKANNVDLGDRLTLYPVSEQDVIEVAQERERLAAIAEDPSEQQETVYGGQPNALHLVSNIIDSL